MPAGTERVARDVTASLAAALDGGPTVRLGGDAAARIEVAGAALLVPTSGSTSGKPNVVVLSSANLRTSAQATTVALGGPGSWLLTLPEDHIAGAMVLIRALLTNSPVVRASRPFRPETFARDVARLTAVAAPRRYCSLVPTQLRRVLADRRATEAARCFDAILVGGAATPARLLRAASEAGLNIVTTYGMTETAGGCVYNGSPLAGVSVALDRDGRISLTGPQVALGYATPEGLKPFDGTFVTSDRGRWDADGRLAVLGRIDDVIVSGGVNVDPHQIEIVGQSVAGIADLAVVGLPDPEWGQAVVAVCVPQPGTTETEAAENLRTVVRERLGPHWVPRQIHWRSKLPLRGIGKVDRLALRTLLQETSRDSAVTLSR